MSVTPRPVLRRYGGLLAGLALFFVFLFLPPPDGVDLAAWRVAAMAILMAVWWMTEAIPVYATGLLPLVLLPFLGVSSMGDAAAPYATPVIFLFMGGFMLALAMQKWGLHKRIALNLLKRTGTRASYLILGFMATAAFLSMWVSNTATAVMMVPIALSVLSLLTSETRVGEDLPAFAPALVLSIAYGANVGGMATLIGTPPNALLAGFFETTYGVTIGFVEWMRLGVPLALVLLGLVWFILTHWSFKIPSWSIDGADDVVKADLMALGKMSRGEQVVAVAFALAALLWITRPVIDDLLPGARITDAGIAMAVALSLFLIPSGDGEQVMDWAAMKDMPWGVLLLFGGGLSLAGAAQSTGLIDWLGASMSALDAVPIIVLLFLVIAAVVFLTELTSNTATTAALLPLLAAAALALGEDPRLLAVPAAFAASCAFMLPAATPPNAIVFGSGAVTLPQMAAAGFRINLVCIAVLVVAVYGALPLAFGVEPGVVPDWAR